MAYETVAGNGGAGPQRTALVVNTRSRLGARTFSEAHDFLRQFGVPPAETYPLHDPARIPETVHEVLHGQRCDLLILGGGDGTVSSVVDFLVDQDAVLGLLPMGTANDFARTLEVPSDLRAACETIARGKVVDVDLGLAGDNYFVNVVSVGLSVGVTAALTPRLKKRMGSLAYPVAAVKAFLGQKPFSARLTFPDGDHEPAEFDRLLQVAVGNGRFYGGGMVVAPGSGIDDQMLDVYALQLGRPRDLLGVARYFRSGDFVRRESVASYRTRRVLLETDPELPMNIDGEVVAQTPKEIRVARNVLRVLVPPDSTAARLDQTAGDADDTGEISR